MKKMMMVLAVLFAMVGSSFGNGILPGFYNVYKGTTSDGWSKVGCVKIVAYYTTGYRANTPVGNINPQINIRTENGSVFQYTCSEQEENACYKVTLSNIINAYNSGSYVNPYVIAKSSNTNVFEFKEIIILK